MKERYTKNDIVKKIVDRLKGKHITIGGNKYAYKRKYHLKYSQEIVNNVISAFLDELVDEIENGNKVSLMGYFTIEPKYRNALKRRDTLKTGEIVEVPAQYRLRVYFGSKLKEACERFSNKKLKEEGTLETH